MENWKKVISENEESQIWINTKNQQLSIKKSQGEKEKFSIWISKDEPSNEKLVAKCESLETAIKWAEKLGINDTEKNDSKPKE